MAADDAGEAVEREHGALAGAAAGDDVVDGATVEQDGGKDAVLDVGELGGVLSGVHTIVVDGVAHGLDDLLECLLDDGVLGGLAVLVDEGDLHDAITPN